MKYTVENEGGSEARITAVRAYPDGINAHTVTLHASAASIRAAERKIGPIVTVRMGDRIPFESRPVRFVEIKKSAADRDFRKAFTPNRHGEYA